MEVFLLVMDARVDGRTRRGRLSFDWKDNVKSALIKGGLNVDGVFDLEI